MAGTYEAQNCTLARALELIGERWTLLIIRDAFYGVRRFNHFRDHLDIPRAVLVERLATLVDNGVFVRAQDPDHAARHLYDLTPLGRDLWPALHALLSWGTRVAGPNQLRFVHVACGNEIDDHGNCPACHVDVPPTDIATEPRDGKARGRTDAVAVALRQRHTLLQPLDASL
ncbi:DNA-binding HxlR family transcriptional regulator [Hamadaea flava]|uniref:Winged helix-turn-helix transcriptional regulator n=1 Tax=Hamadaea flava TaxID=1742688 RepID=A0ABV8LL46_9ACTN|nr:helix-turn-helix domain-containing protein [Hamadaea flava]MCP2324157.1 DNA-binding HxlR family transcriptional regulator [Hamadaea flava]